MAKEKENWFFNSEDAPRKDEKPFVFLCAELEQKQRALEKTRAIFVMQLLLTIFMAAISFLGVGMALGMAAEASNAPTASLEISSTIGVALLVLACSFALLYSGWNFRNLLTMWKDFIADKEKINADRLALFGHDDFYTDSTEGKKIR